MAVTISGTDGITTPDIDTDGLSVDTNAIFVDPATNNVGIGTNLPNVSLQVNGGIRARGGIPGGGGFNNNGYAFSGNGGDNDSGMFSSADGQLEFYSNNVERMRINDSGNLLVGITTGNSRITAVKDNPAGFSTAQLELISLAGDVVLGFHAGGATAVCLDHIRGGGSVRCVNLSRSAFAPLEASAFIVNSDYRLKENVQPLTHALERLAQIPVHRFSFIKDSMSYADGVIVDGFIAHEVQAVVPEAITGEKDEVDEDGNPVHQGIDQSKLVPLLTAAIQEQQTLIQALTARIEALEVA